MKLLGLPRSMAETPRKLDRSTVWPLDLATGQKSWRAVYDAPPSDFFIVYGPYSREEHVGYFLTPTSRVSRFRRSGELTGEWSSLTTFIDSELIRAQAVYAK